MTATRRTSVTIASLIALALLGTAGACANTPPDDAASPSPSVSASASPSPTATVAGPTVAPEVPINCDTIIPATRKDALVSSGLTLTAPADFFAKVASEGQPSVFNLFQANGGIVCAWGNGSEVVAVYGYSPLPAEQVANASDLIQNSDPFSVSDFDGGTLFTSQMDGNPFSLFLILDPHIYLASTSEILDEVRTAIS